MRYLWSVPTGCLDDCIDPNRVATLNAPRQVMQAWNWTNNGNNILGGNNCFPAPLQLTTSGSYSLFMNNGNCSATTQAFNYNLQECKRCPIEDVRVTSNKVISDPFCSYDITIQVLSAETFPASLSCTNPNFIFVPSGLQIFGSTADYQFTMIPVNNFTGGMVTCTITGTTRDGQPCITDFQINLERCIRLVNRGATAKSDLLHNVKTIISIAPNPANNYVNINFSDLTINSVIEVYDLTSRLIAKYNNIEQNGFWNLDTATLPKSMYFIVAKEKDEIISQQKLIIK